MSISLLSNRALHYKNGTFIMAELPKYSLKCGYKLALGIFLDKFYACEDENKFYLIKDEPETGILNDFQHCKLAAAAHKLANDYFLNIPPWVMRDKYIMPYPVYAFDSDDIEHQKLLRETTPDEYKIRNLFLGSGVLKRA